MKSITSLVFLIVSIFLVESYAIAENKVVIVPINKSPKKIKPDQYITTKYEVVGSGENGEVYSPPCPSGYRLSGGGFGWGQYDSPAITGCRPVMGENAAYIEGANAADRYLCQGKNTKGFPLALRCWSVCILVP